MQVSSLKQIDGLTWQLRAIAEPAEMLLRLRREDLDEVLDAAPRTLGLNRTWNRWYSGDDTIEAFLASREVALTPKERSRFALEARFRKLLAASGPRPGADATPEELAGWLADRDLSWLLDHPVGAHLPSWSGLVRDRRALEHWRWRDLYGLRRTSNDEALRGGALRVSRALMEVLDRVLAHHHVMRLDASALVAGLGDRPEELPAAFAEFWGEASSRFTRLADLVDEPVGPMSWQGWHSAGVEGQRWRLRLDGEPLFVRLRRPPGVPLMADCRPPIEARALGQVLTELRQPQRCEELQLSLEVGLDLGSLEPPPPDLASVDTRELGFRVLTRKDKVVIDPVLVDPEQNALRTTKVALSDAHRRAGLSRQDRTVLRRLRQASRSLGGGAALAEAVFDLSGHPWVFRSSRKGAVPVPVRVQPLVLSLDDTRGWGSARWQLGGVEVASADLLQRLAWAVDEEQPLGVWLLDDQIVVFEVTGPALAALRFLKRNEDQVPPEVVGPLLARLDGLDEVPLALAPSLEGRLIDGDPAAILRLEGTDQGLLVSARVQPGPDTRTYPPGEGPERLRGRDGEGRWTVVRDHELELHTAEARWRALDIVLPVSGTPEALMLGESVALLEALKEEVPPGEVRWAGPRRTVVQAASSGLRLRLKEQGRMLALGGSVTVDGSEVPVAEVLAALRGGRRYLSLDLGRIARLHGTLADRLETLSDLTWTEQGEDRVSALAAPVVADLEALGATVEAPPSWEARRVALARATSQEPALPDGLRATLRPYQVEGVRWLLRLAAWGLGGVLADDMGLGKTLQALAVLLARPTAGPALVVAPTSVVGTWRREAARFAPDLDVRVYHGPNREAALIELGPGTVLLTSWGTLVADAELLCATAFATVVLDEAHAIKNPSTRRARAARELQAGFVVALTGTPVENHPGELWSLLRVAAPGLLGSKRAFDHRFGRPIVEHPGCPEQGRLAALIRPFLLRRTKDQVATELPPREEMVVRVPLTAQERAVYEGLRRAGLGELPEQDEDVAAVQVLAVLTRLRQAASHAGLIVEDIGDSSKLKAARRVIGDLRAAGHKALVFSQFVGLLDVLAAQLDREGLALGRIDGRVTRGRREMAIQAFQGGDTEVMLLSLQAGGVGLNLTAASYVIHLDPWWNPAVQDQATDRAHRIGQDRPVTVVHLIAEDTVEEGIRELQRDKRALAKGLLEGAGGAAALDSAALLALIRDGAGVDEIAEEQVTVASRWVASREAFSEGD